MLLEGDGKGIAASVGNMQVAVVVCCVVTATV